MTGSVYDEGSEGPETIISTEDIIGSLRWAIVSRLLPHKVQYGFHISKVRFWSFPRERLYRVDFTGEERDLDETSSSAVVSVLFIDGLRGVVTVPDLAPVDIDFDYSHLNAEKLEIYERGASLFSRFSDRHLTADITKSISPTAELNFAWPTEANQQRIWIGLTPGWEWIGQEALSVWMSDVARLALAKRRLEAQANAYAQWMPPDAGTAELMAADAANDLARRSWEDRQRQTLLKLDGLEPRGRQIIDIVVQNFHGFDPPQNAGEIAIVTREPPFLPGYHIYEITDSRQFQIKRSTLLCKLSNNENTTSELWQIGYDSVNLFDDLELYLGEHGEHMPEVWKFLGSIAMNYAGVLQVVETLDDIPWYGGADWQKRILAPVIHPFRVWKLPVGPDYRMHFDFLLQSNGAIDRLYLSIAVQPRTTWRALKSSISSGSTQTSMSNLECKTYCYRREETIVLNRKSYA